MVPAVSDVIDAANKFSEVLSALGSPDGLALREDKRERFDREQHEQNAGNAQVSYALAHRK